MEGEEDKDATTKTATDKNGARRRRPKNEAEAGGAEGTQELQTTEDIIDTDELSEKMDEVNNHEHHRTKGGRDLSASS